MMRKELVISIVVLRPSESTKYPENKDMILAPRGLKATIQDILAAK